MTTSNEYYEFQKRTWEFLEACKNNDMNNIVLLVKQGVNIHFNNEEAFQVACWKGDIEIVRYLTTLCNLKIHEYKFNKINIRVYNEQGFNYACMNGHIEVVKYLATLYKQKMNNGNNYKMIDIHIGNDMFFRGSCHNGRINILIYLIQLTKKTTKNKKQYTPFNIYAMNNDCMRYKYPVKYIFSLGNYNKKIDTLFI